MTGLEKLQEIGAHKIYEQTHIARKFVEDILKQNFSTMNKIQFTGFISIIEREYSVDLHELIDAYNNFHNSETSSEKEPFVVSQQEGTQTKKTDKKIYIISGLLFAGLLFLIFSPSSEEEKASTPQAEAIQTVSVDKELNNTTIETAKATLTHLGNTTIEAEVTEQEVSVEPVHTTKFEIIPRSKLWIGIVDLGSYKRTQRLSADPFELDADKEWLLVMGHGYVNFEVNGEESKYKDENKVWFGYENGKLEKLTRAEFKEKNRGKAW